MPECLEELNPTQLAATTADRKSLLILAGAGSGKTRVLVNRTAWLIQQQQSSAGSIMSVTFTNKAANEMRDRLGAILDTNINRLWVGTFHGLAHRMLRKHWQAAGLPANFQIIDTEDQLRIIKGIYKRYSIDDEVWPPRKVLHFIQKHKDQDLRQTSNSAQDQIVSHVFNQYQLYLDTNGLIDFADILLKAHLALQNKEVLAEYQARFLHILVDEFQDTNNIQYEWLKLLAANCQTITIVGDDDQSIYGWRGAKIENMQRFLADFPTTEVIRLEQNYRSTNAILNCANALINNNQARMGKNLWTQAGEGEPVTVYSAYNETDEASFIVRTIRQRTESGDAYADVGILYRSNAQSRILEENLINARIPFKIYGGLRFFERAEIKDCLAYLKLACNLEDNSSFDRIINNPPRGIGQKTLDKIQSHAESTNSSHWQAVKSLLNDSTIVGKSQLGLAGFVKLIDKIQEDLDRPLGDTIRYIVQTSGLLTYLQNQRGEKAQSRAANLEELVNACDDFAHDPTVAGSNPAAEFLAYAALDATLDTNQQEHGVQLMTIHAAKGLEFKTVYICGLEEGLFPHHFSRDSEKQVEEERRLAYVGITRAKQKLYLCYASKRRMFGNDEQRKKSRFLDEIPQNLLEFEQKKVSISRAYNFESAVKNSPSRNLSNSPLTKNGFTVGQMVEHTKFGVGEVIDFEGNDDRARIKIHFSDGSYRWLVIAFAKLRAV